MQYAAHLLGGTGSLRLLVFQEDIAFRLTFEHCARQVESAAAGALEGVRGFFRAEQERWGGLGLAELGWSHI